ncbi:hypothetical protein Taro_010448 [Colocasia esculenta]|uniref:TF-B3 domain-containing protein n=1 Tax=Colocasia esculenta TaxID=4460 RepID=A0A843U7Q8_COLES|nr:hypothetical protein [Colocasia esculenta]
MESQWEGEDAFLACVLGKARRLGTPAGQAGRREGEEEPGRKEEESGRRALVGAEFLRVVQGFGPSRRKKRSARQRRLVLEPFSLGAAATTMSPIVRREPQLPRSPTAISDLGADVDSPGLYFDQSRGFLRFLLQKELRKSDVGSLGRMVLPKKDAEAHLPVLFAREGIYICMEDMEASHLWTFKYRYWPNNKSRMYILEHTGDFVRRHGLKLGDFVMLYRDDYRQRYVIRAKKAAYKESPSAEAEEGTSEPSPGQDHLVPDADHHGGHLDVYLPMDDELCLAMDTTYTFSADFTVGLSNGMMDSFTTMESVPSLGSIENLSLDDFS